MDEVKHYEPRISGMSKRKYELVFIIAYYGLIGLMLTPFILYAAHLHQSIAGNLTLAGCMRILGILTAIWISRWDCQLKGTKLTICSKYSLRTHRFDVHDIRNIERTTQDSLTGRYSIIRITYGEKPRTICYSFANEEEFLKDIQTLRE